jgi:hypothetical protein
MTPATGKLLHCDRCWKETPHVKTQRKASPKHVRRAKRLNTWATISAATFTTLVAAGSIAGFATGTTNAVLSGVATAVGIVLPWGVLWLAFGGRGFRLARQKAYTVRTCTVCGQVYRDDRGPRADEPGILD